MRLRHLVLTLTFPAALASDSRGRSRQPSGPIAQIDPRGTDQMPIAVKIVPAPGAEQPEHDSREKTETDRLMLSETQRMAKAMRWLAALTAALVAIALLQGVVFSWQ